MKLILINKNLSKNENKKEKILRIKITMIKIFSSNIKKMEKVSKRKRKNFKI